MKPLPLLLPALLLTACGSPPPAPPRPAEAAADANANVSPSTRAMAERLERLREQSDPIRSVLAGDYEPRLAAIRETRAAAGSVGEKLRLTLLLADELLGCGRNREALEQLDLLERELARPELQAPLPLRTLVSRRRAVAWLRIGETANCLARHGPESCLLPIRGSGVHVEKEGSKQAVEALTTLLERDPSDLAARWLLNVAHMTLGTWPEGVDARWRIDPEHFEPEGSFPRFENIAGRAGVDVNALSGGVVAEDLDGDRRIDLVTSSWGMDHQLRVFANLGGNRFRERTSEAGVTGEVGGLNLAHADYDNDGDVDLLVLRGAWGGAQGRHPNSLLANRGDGTFTDVTEEAGLLAFHPSQAGTWADYDGDGWLDLFVGNESGEGEVHPCQLFRNQGDGTFRDVAPEVGLDVVGFVKAAAWGDYDDDGRPDLYLSQLGQPNRLLRNEGPGEDGRWSFRDVTRSAGVAEPRDSFPTWFFDYDNDGRLDLLVLPFRGFQGATLGEVAADVLGLPNSGARPRLYRNRGDGGFEDVTAEAGLDDVLLAMGSNFGDLDADGWPEVYVGTGEPNLATLVPNRLYRNERGRRFLDVTSAAGLGHLQKGHGIAFADFDDDGDLDVFAVMGGAYPADTAHDALFLNPGHGHRWLGLLLEGVRSNRSAIGARIRVRLAEPDGERDVHAVVGTGGSFGSSSLRQLIGLGQASRVLELEIRWPASGQVQRFADVPFDRSWRVREGASALEALEPPA